jgi:hypothetical protein
MKLPKQSAKSPKKTICKPKETGHFSPGHKVGSATRFRKRRQHYGTCRECKSSASTVSRSTDWFCKACCCYTKKRGQAGSKA